MIFGIIALVICTIMTFEKELVDNNSISSSSSSLPAVTTTTSHLLKTMVDKNQN